MAKVKPTKSSNPPKKMRPALTPEARENQLISLAVDLAEQLSHSLHASPSAVGFMQLMAFAKIRAQVVFPTPRGPQNR